MNQLKYKKKEENSFFLSIEPSTSSKFQKFDFIKLNQKKKPQQPIKLQRSYRQPRIHASKNRYQSLENSPQRRQQVRSLSIRRSNQQTQKSFEKSILFKRPVRNKHKSIDSSFDVSRQQVNPYSDRNKRSYINKKLTIVDRESNHEESVDSRSLSKKQLHLVNPKVPTQNSRKSTQSKFRVKSTFTKLDSIELVKTISQQSSSKTLIDKQKSISVSKRKSLQNLQKIKILVKSQHFKQALQLIKKCLSQNYEVDNVQLLEMLLSSLYNLDEFLEVTKVIQKIFAITLQCKSETYVMACLSFAKIKNYPKALQVIERGTVKYSQNAQIFYYKGKILNHIKKYHLALEAFKKSYEICSLPQTLICLIDCYGKNDKKGEEFQALQILLAQKDVQALSNYDIYYIRRLKVLFQLEKFDSIIQIIKSSQKENKIQKNAQVKAEMQFIEALCKYKNGRTSEAYQKFEDCIVSQYFCLQSLKMLIVLEIKENNFYQAYHLCSQAIRKGIKIENDQVFEILLTFVQGSINLVRRNFKEGVQYLSKTQISLDQKQFKKHNSLSNKSVQNHECLKIVRELIHLFLGYGLFCMGEYIFCQTAINKQKQTHCDLKYSKGLQYNYKLCEAILSFKERAYSRTLSILQEADDIFPSRLEVLFYKAVVLIQVFCQKTQRLDAQQNFSVSEDSKMVESIKECLQEAIKKVSSTANNTRATIFYYKSLFHAYMKEWKEALISIEDALSKTEDNYWRYYYTKAMILACVHNFQDAITQLNVAINLSDGRRAECFLLRSKCLQIEARGSQAFFDLQQYIALKPDDDQVHKYAGQLLFQNGAFEDALTAFEHQQITPVPENYDIFLTLAKTLFLTGKFNQSYLKMVQACKVKSQQNQVLFDANIIKFTGMLLDQINNKIIKQSQSSLNSQLIECFHSESSSRKFGKIFKQIDFYLFKALIAIYSGDYLESIENFRKHLTEKRKMIIFDDNSESNSKFLAFKSQQDLQKTSNQLKIYTNQMKYNISVCYLAGGDISAAKDVLKDIKIDESQNFYHGFLKFRNSILNQTFQFQKEQVLPNKNKLSQFLPSLNINFTSKKIQTKLKLCIPFPKVQPPEIFPVFDDSLLKTLTFFAIEGKPQAPWIVKEDNVIKFTEKISYASRLDFSDSQHSNSATVIIDIDDSSNSIKNPLKTNSNERSSLFSKRTLKKKNSVNQNF